MSTEGDEAKRCPRCDDGKYNGKDCAVCGGTGQLSKSGLPAIRPGLLDMSHGRTEDPQSDAKSFKDALQFYREVWIKRDYKLGDWPIHFAVAFAAEIERRKS